MSLRVVFISSFLIAGLFFGIILFIPILNINEKIPFNVTIEYTEKEEYYVEVPVTVQIPYQEEVVQENEVWLSNGIERTYEENLLRFDMTLSESSSVFIEWSSTKPVFCFALLYRESLLTQVESIESLISFYKEDEDTLILLLKSVLSESDLLLFNKNEFSTEISLNEGDYSYLFLVIDLPNTITHESYYITSNTVIEDRIKKEIQFINETRYRTLNKTRIETQYSYESKKVSIWYKLMNP
jgi:hypothetical protein